MKVIEKVRAYEAEIKSNTKQETQEKRLKKTWAKMTSSQDIQSQPNVFLLFNRTKKLTLK